MHDTLSAQQYTYMFWYLTQKHQLESGLYSYLLYNIHQNWIFVHQHKLQHDWLVWDPHLYEWSTPSLGDSLQLKQNDKKFSNSNSSTWQCLLYYNIHLNSLFGFFIDTSTLNSICYATYWRTNRKCFLYILRVQEFPSHWNDCIEMINHIFSVMKLILYYLNDSYR